MPERKKPVVQLSEKDTLFSQVSRMTQALKDAGMTTEAAAFTQKVYDCTTYADMLQVIRSYVEVKQVP